MRFNPPPGWPPIPPGWTPPAGWRPDPSWPPPPAGWQLWVEDTGQLAYSTAPASVAERAARRAVGGGAAVALGSFLPFVYQPGVGLLTLVDVHVDLFDDHVAARPLPFLFGLALVGGALLMRTPRFQRTARAWTFIGAALGGCGYSLFAITGIVGISTDLGFGITAKVTWAPNIGLLMSIVGCVVVGVAAAQVIKNRQPPQQLV